jgi:hypothetical protein
MLTIIPMRISLNASHIHGLELKVRLKGLVLDIVMAVQNGQGLAGGQMGRASQRWKPQSSGGLSHKYYILPH